MKRMTILVALLLAALATAGCETKRGAAGDQGRKAFELQI